MQISKKQLKLQIKKILKEEFALAEDLDWDLEPDHPDRQQIPGEYILDELVNAARDAVMPIIIDKLKATNAYRQGVRSNNPGDVRMDAPGMTDNDIALEIEEPLLDALKPIAVMLYHKAEAGRY